MSRKNQAPKREVLPDPLYNSKLVTRLINRVMLDGKRGTAASIVYGAFDQIKEATGNDALEVFETAMENIMPVLEVRARRVGGSNYQVPVEVRPERRTTLGLFRYSRHPVAIFLPCQSCKREGSGSLYLVMHYQTTPIPTIFPLFDLRSLSLCHNPRQRTQHQLLTRSHSWQ